MSVDPLSYPSPSFYLPTYQTNFWANLTNPELFLVNNMTSQQGTFAINNQASDAILICDSEGNPNIASCLTIDGGKSNGHFMLQNQPPSEYQLFGMTESTYRSPLDIFTNNNVNKPIVFGEASSATQGDSIASLSTQISSQRLQHFHHRHHAQAQKQAYNVKNKPRFSATGATNNYMVVRDSKMSLSSAPSSPNAGSLGGSLGNHYMPSHAPSNNNAYTVQQCKGSSSSSSSYSSKNSKMSTSSSLSSYSSCSSLSSTPSMNGISPRKRRADDTSNNNRDLYCRKEYYQREGDIINLCSCETCATDDVTARVDDVTLRDVISGEHEQRQKRSKNDDDVVFVSAEPGPVRPPTRVHAHVPRQQDQIWSPYNNDTYSTSKERPVRKTKKSTKKVVTRNSTGQSHTSISDNFPFVVPSSMSVISPRNETEELVGRYFLRSAVKCRKQEDIAVETAQTSDGQQHNLVQSIVAPVVTHSVARAIDLNNNAGVHSHSTTTTAADKSNVSTSRYHTRSRQKKAKPGTSSKSQPQTVAKPQAPSDPVRHQQYATPSAYNYHAPTSTCHPASVIQTAANGQYKQKVPTSVKSPAETTEDSPRSSPSFKKVYDIHGIIGVGGGGTVYAGTRKADGVQVAIKQVPKAKVKRWGKLNDRVVPIEFELLYRASNTSHKGIIGMLDWYERRSAYILVMERPQPVIDLFDYLNQYGALPEATARSIFRQIAEAVIHCHANGVVHRDIKDENVLLNLHTSEAKLIDFGCGTVLKDTPFTEFAGTPEFYPPEWFTHRRYYGQRVDAWSLGVLLFTMVEAEVPFQKEKDIVECNLRHKHGDRLSESCKHLIKWMLQKDQNVRPTIAQVLRHPWFTHADPTAPTASSGVMGTNELYERRLHQHQNDNHKAAAPTPVAESSSHHEIASTESPESPPRYNQVEDYQQRGNYQPQNQTNAVFQTQCIA